jgi:ABC-type multidrug transport system fused ATPase/permease subunit
LPARGHRLDTPDPSVEAVSVEGLRVEYPGRAEAALDGISLTVAPREILAITGPSGSGKSTLLSVLLGFVSPQGGTVRVGDVELSDLDPEAWRAQVAWMPQRPHLFAASIADNIRLGRLGATRHDVWEAALAAGLGEVIAGKPDGLETMLGERGSGLSVGERQRVALARAFLRDAPLLLLDEPTANLDGMTEDATLEALDRLVRGRTVVLVAHRPALVALADRVIEIDRMAVTV